MVVDAVSKLDTQTLDLKMIGIKKVTGGGLRDSFLVGGPAWVSLQARDELQAQLQQLHSGVRRLPPSAAHPVPACGPGLVCGAAPRSCPAVWSV